MDDEDFRALDMMTWLYIEALDEEGIADRFDVGGWLPDSVPLEWTRAWAWSNQFACYDGDLIRSRGESMIDVRAEFCKKVLDRIDRLCTDTTFSVRRVDVYISYEGRG